MNTKVMLFISTALTAFVVVTLYGVVTKVSSNPTPVSAASEDAYVQVVAPSAATVADTSKLFGSIYDVFGNVIAAPSPYANMEMNHDLAAVIASDAIQRLDVYSVELKTIAGVAGYEVVFSSNDVVFIGLDKQVVSISTLPTQIVYLASVPGLFSATDDYSGNGSSYDNDDDNDQDEDIEDVEDVEDVEDDPEFEDN